MRLVGLLLLVDWQVKFLLVAFCWLVEWTVKLLLVVFCWLVEWLVKLLLVAGQVAPFCWLVEVIAEIVPYYQKIHPVLCQWCRAKYPSIAKQESQDALEILDEPQCFMWKITLCSIQVLLVLFCNKWWTLWILLMIVFFVAYNLNLLPLEVECCKRTGLMIVFPYFSSMSRVDLPSGWAEVACESGVVWSLGSFTEIYILTTA